MFRTIVRRAAESPGWSELPSRPPPVNPYKTKKVWPPDFSKLSPQEQLRFEKRYKRRVKFASARPRFNRIIRMAQLLSVTAIGGYCVLFMDWKNETQPFEGLREKFWGAFGYDPTRPIHRRTGTFDDRFSNTSK